MSDLVYLNRKKFETLIEKLYTDGEATEFYREAIDKALPQLYDHIEAQNKRIAELVLEIASLRGIPVTSPDKQEKDNE